MKKYFFTPLFLSLYLQAQVIDLSSQLLLNQFELARSKAIEILTNFKTCNLASNTPIETRLWLDKNTQSLITDLQVSKFFTVADKQPTCAYTVHLPNQPIFISVPSCFKGPISQEKLVHTLIHETTHHLGVSNEIDADKIATAVISSNLNNCTNNDNVFDFFDPKVCQGNNITLEKVRKVFQKRLDNPQQSPYIDPMIIDLDKKIGNLDLFIRTRECDDLGFCKSWQNASLMTFQSQKLNGLKRPLLETIINLNQNLKDKNDLGHISSSVVPFERVGSNWNYAFSTQGGANLNLFQNSSIFIYPYTPVSGINFYYSLNDLDQARPLPEDRIHFNYFKTLENCSWGINQQKVNFGNKSHEIQIVVYGKNNLDLK